MKRWPILFTLKIGSTFIMYTCYLFTFFTIGDYFILGKEQDGKQIISNLVMAIIMAIVSILLELKKWREKLLQAREELRIRKNR